MVYGGNIDYLLERGYTYPGAPQVTQLPDQPAPKLPKQAEAARKWLLKLLKRKKPRFPVLDIPGMTDIEEMGQSVLADIIAGKTFEDPRTSDLWEGLREELRAEEAEGVSGLRRRAQMGGVGFAGPSVRAEGEYRKGMATRRTSLLGELYERERARDNPYTRMAAVSAYGGLPREIEGAQEAAQYQSIMQRLMFPYTTRAPIAAGLANLPFTPVPQQNWLVNQPAAKTTSGSSGIGGIIGGILSALASIPKTVAMGTATNPWLGLPVL